MVAPVESQTNSDEMTDLFVENETNIVDCMGEKKTIPILEFSNEEAEQSLHGNLSSEPTALLNILPDDVEVNFFSPQLLCDEIMKSDWVNEYKDSIEKLPSKCFVEYVGSDGFTPVQLAILRRSESAFLMLEKYFEETVNDFYHIHKYCKILLDFSTQEQYKDIFEFISRKYNQHFINYCQCFKIKEPDALYRAIISDDEIALTEILKNESFLLETQLLFKDKNGDTPLHQAVYRSRSDIVFAIINTVEFKKTNAGVQKNKGELTPRQFSMHSKQLEIVWVFLNSIRNFRAYSFFDILFDAIQYGSLDVVNAILSRINDDDSLEVWFPEDPEKISVLAYALYVNRIDIAQSITQKIFNGNQIFGNIIKTALQTSRLDIIKTIFETHNVILKKNPFSVRCHGLHPVNYAAMYLRFQVIECLWEMMGETENNKYIIIGKNGNTTLHYAAQGGDILTAKMVWSKIRSNSIDDVNPPNKLLKTPLHLATTGGNKEIVELVYSYMENPTALQINPFGYHGSTPLHIAASKGYTEIFNTIMKRIPDGYVLKFLNQKDELNATVLYKSIGASNHDITRDILRHDGVHLNGIGKKPILSFFSGIKRKTSPRYLIGEMLRNRGCLEYRFQNGHESRITQGSQSIHASMTTITLNKSLSKLRSGKKSEDIQTAFNHFCGYCKQSNPAFMNDLKSIEINQSSFSRNLIVQALSSVSPDKAARVFAKAIEDKFAQMESAAAYWPDFKERCGLIWLSLHDPIEQTKFYDLRVFSNPELHRQGVDKLRRHFLVQLIETRFEYLESVREEGENDTDESENFDDWGDENNELYDTNYLKALKKSQMACPAGTCNFLIECFSFMHTDIIVLEAELPPVFEASSSMKEMIGHNLSLLISKAYQSNPILFEDLLDRFLGVSDEVLTEMDVIQYLSNVKHKNNIFLIGRLLGAVKSSLRSNQDIMESIEKYKVNLFNAFVILEDLLSTIHPGQLCSALMEGFRESYQIRVRTGEIDFQNPKTLDDYSLRIKLQEAFQSIDILKEEWFKKITSSDLRLRIANYLNKDLSLFTSGQNEVINKSLEQGAMIKFSLTNSGVSEKRKADNSTAVVEKTKRIRFTK